MTSAAVAPAGMLQKKDLPPRWGLLAYGPAGITVVVRADWMECERIVSAGVIFSDDFN